MAESFYSVEQIATLLKLHPKTVQRYIREGRLKAAKVGKSWRVNGHDLSVFVEGPQLGGAEGSFATADGLTEIKVHVSAVVDIEVGSRSEAQRIVNGLTAALNAKPAEYGQSSLNAQVIEPEHKVRLMLWGSLAFMETMMASLAMLTTKYDMM
jgi:excisionase family DNA binding protein